MRHLEVRDAFFRLAARTLQPRSQAEEPPERKHNVLILKPDNLGDVLLASPAIHLLRQQWPDARLTLAVGPWGAPMARHLPDVDQVAVIPFPGVRQDRQPSLLARWLLLVRLAWRWRGRFDAGLVLRDDFYWGAMLLAAAQVPIRAGSATPLCLPFLTHAVLPARRPAAAQHLRVAAMAADCHPGPDHWTPERSLRFEGGDDGTAEAFRRVAGLHVGEPFILLQPGAGAAIKLWTAEGWAVVVRGLHAATGLRTLLVAGPAEQALLPPIVRRCASAACVAPGAPDLATLATLMRHATLVLGPDSGPLHLAAALDVPSVRLYGPTDPLVWGPWVDPQRHRAVASRMLCAPCDRLTWNRLDLPWHPCVPRLDPEEVLAAALALTPASLRSGVPFGPPLPRGEGQG